MMRGPLARSAQALPLAIAGFLLPLMAVSKLGSLSHYLRPFEILEAYGTSVLLHLPILFVTALLGLFAALLAEALPRRARAAVVERLPVVLLSAGFGLAVFMGARPLLDPRGLVGTFSPALLAGLAIGAGATLGALWPRAAAGAVLPAGLLTGAGAVSALVAVLMAVRAPGQVPPAPARSSDRPDILLITLDSLANAHLSAIGHRRPTTPTIDRLAAAGTFFTHTVASSNYTTPTLATLMTGLHPWRHKALQLKSQPVSDAVAGGLPARLHAGGYVLRAVSTNPYGGPHKNGFGPWFETVAADRLRWLTGCSDWLSRYLPRACAATEIGVIDPLAARINLLLDWLGAWEPGRHLDPRLAFTAAAQLWVKPTGGRPKFLWVHVVPPHDPYVAPAPFLGRFDGSPGARTIPDSRPLFHFSFSAEGPARQQLLEARYDESIAATDADLAAFVETLERDGQLSNAVVILSSDHGESFSHDYGGHGGPMLHEPLIRIPLIFAGLGIPVGNRISTPVEQADVPATIIALAGLNVPSEWDGRSLLTLIRAGGGAWKPTLSMNLESSSRFGTPIAGSVARTEGRWKLVHYWGLPNKPGVRDLRTSLFDLETDPGERADLSAANPARAAGMRARIEQALAAAWPN